MSSDLIISGGAILAYFVLSLFLPAVWLIVCKLVPALRDRVGLSYGVAIALSFAFTVFVVAESAQDLQPSIAGALLCAGLLFWQFTRAKAKLGANPVPDVTAQ